MKYPKGILMIFSLAVIVCSQWTKDKLFSQRYSIKK